MGIPLREGEPIALAVLVDEMPPDEAESALITDLQSLIGRPVVVTFTRNPDMRPPDSVEIVLASLPRGGESASAPEGS